MHIPDPLIYRYSFSDLPVNPGHLELLMGYEEGESPEPIAGMIGTIFSRAEDHAEIKGGIVLLEHFRISRQDHIIIRNIDFDIGKTIAGNLTGLDKIAFFLMTAGPGIESWSRQEIARGESLSGYLIDLLGSEIVESAADLMQAELENKISGEGYQTTNRYSPGYCGWQLNEQKKLFSLFPAGFCGITLSESSLMIPLKSVSGIIGIGRDVEKTDHICHLCDFQNCIYRDRRIIK